jgi:hypothetical protein
MLCTRVLFPEPEGPTMRAFLGTETRIEANNDAAVGSNGK